MSSDAEMVAVTMDDVVNAVLSSDAITAVRRQAAAQPGAVKTVVDIALRQTIGLRGLCGCEVHVDLGNGHVLVCNVKKAIDSGAPAGVKP